MRCDVFVGLAMMHRCVELGRSCHASRCIEPAVVHRTACLQATCMAATNKDDPSIVNAVCGPELISIAHGRLGPFHQARFLSCVTYLHQQLTAIVLPAADPPPAWSGLLSAQYSTVPPRHRQDDSQWPAAYFVSSLPGRNVLHHAAPLQLRDSHISRCQRTIDR